MSGAGRSFAAGPSAAVERTARRVWLTFDDGPSRRCTPAILGILRHHEVKATFFVVGRMIAGAESVLDQIEMDGHAVGNHSFSHSDLTRLNEEQIAREILQTEKMIAKHATLRKIFRPPYGRRNARVDRVATELGYASVAWDVNPKNLGPPMPGWVWPRYGVYLVRRRLSSCVLLHDIHPATVAQLDRFLRHLKELGNVAFEPPSTLPEYGA